MLQAKIDSLPVGDPIRKELTTLLEASDAEALRKLKMLNEALPTITPLAAVAAGVPGVAPVPVLPAAPIPTYTVQVDKIFQQVTDSARRSVGKLETWFSSTMDRVTQRFAVQMRLWTVAFAFLIAFGAHLDSLRLLDQLSANPETRAALVSMRDGMQSEAQTLLPPPGAATASASVPVSPAILNEALVRLVNDPAVPKKIPVAVPKTIPPDVLTVQDAQAWLTQLPGVPPPQPAITAKP